MISEPTTFTVIVPCGNPGPEKAQGGDVDAVAKRAADASAEENNEKAVHAMTPTCPDPMVLGRSSSAPAGGCRGTPSPSPPLIPEPLQGGKKRRTVPPQVVEDGRERPLARLPTAPSRARYDAVERRRVDVTPQ